MFLIVRFNCFKKVITLIIFLFFYFGTKIVFKIKVYFCERINILSGMKKVAIILLITFITALAISSCNRQTCPAYSKADVEHAGHIG
jgi:hypothetical protein